MDEAECLRPVRKLDALVERSQFPIHVTDLKARAESLRADIARPLGLPLCLRLPESALPQRVQCCLLRASGVRSGSILEFAEWMKETDLDDTYELAVHRHSSDAVAFCEKIIPRLRELLRAELCPQETVHV